MLYPCVVKCVTEVFLHFVTKKNMPPPPIVLFKLKLYSVVLVCIEEAS